MIAQVEHTGPANVITDPFMGSGMSARGQHLENKDG